MKYVECTSSSLILYNKSGLVVTYIHTPLVPSSPHELSIYLSRANTAGNTFMCVLKYHQTLVSGLVAQCAQNRVCTTCLYMVRKLQAHHGKSWHVMATCLAKCGTRTI